MADPIATIFGFCVWVLQVISDFTGWGYQLANIIVFIIVQPGLILLFFVLRFTRTGESRDGLSLLRCVPIVCRSVTHPPRSARSHRILCATSGSEAEDYPLLECELRERIHVTSLISSRCGTPSDPGNLFLLAPENPDAYGSH